VLLVVPASGDESDRLVDLRVEDADDPLGELRRLLRLNDAYVLAGDADAHLAAGDTAEASRLYVAAHEAAPEHNELRFWAALGLVAAGDEERGRDLLTRTIDADGRWLELLRRLRPDQEPSRGAAIRLLGQG
jgi:uncharacterized Ntn-hydrolase superfamily protein